MKVLPKQFDYFRIKTIHSNFLIEFETLKEMLRFTEKNSIKSIFVIPEKDGAPEMFACSNKGGLLQHNTEGYITLEEYKNSESNEFPDAATYYEGMRLGFNKFSEYKMSTETGIIDASEYEEIKKGGYIQEFQELEKARKESEENLPFAEIKNAAELRKWIKDKKFESIFEFSRARKKGFVSPLEFREAELKGFETYKDYKAGAANGFSFGKDYYLAAENGIETFEEFVLFNELELLEIQETAHDRKLICVLLSKINEGKKTPLNKLFDMLNESKKAYLKKDGTMPEWFDSSLHNLDNLIEYVSGSEYIRKYGTCDLEGEFFENKKLSDRLIILDGSNVAFGKIGGSERRPFLKNILTMVKFLKKKGFSDIIVFTDAAIKHRFTDREYLTEIEQLCKFSYTPAETSADKFLIGYVKQNHCLLISNDKFRDWKIEDPWVAVNIDYYRLPFMIEGEKVLVPALD